MERALGVERDVFRSISLSACKLACPPLSAMMWSCTAIPKLTFRARVDPCRRLHGLPCHFSVCPH
jgi:hypothetical protein